MMRSKINKYPVSWRISSLIIQLILKYENMVIGLIIIELLGILGTPSGNISQV
jgi:hypothetical protein